MKRDTQNKVGSIARGAWGMAKKAARFCRDKAALIAAGGAVTVATVQPAQAQDPTAANSGVAAIVEALNGLKPDIGFVVVAAIAVALIGMGAAVALSVGKRMMGR